MDNENTKVGLANFFNDDKQVKNFNDRKEHFEVIDFEKIVSNIYNDIFKKSPDISFIKKYSNQLKFKLITEDKLKTILKEELQKSQGISENIKSIIDEVSSNKPIITYCMMGTNKIAELKPYIENILSYVDKFIFIDGGSTDGTLEYMKSLNIEVHQHQWQDKFSAQRNNYLNYLKEKNYNGWVIVSDTDEHYPIESLKEIRRLISLFDNKEYNGISIQVEDILVDDYDFTKIISRSKNDYWKNLVFKYYPELRYVGEPHELLVGHNIKWYRSDIIYQHKRSNLHILSRAVENFFISNSNRYSEKWSDFRLLCTKNNINSFDDFWIPFKQHNLPKDVEKWIIDHKDDNIDNGDSEVREMYILYDKFNIKVPKIEIQKIEITPTLKVEPQNDKSYLDYDKWFFVLEKYLCERCGSHEPLISLRMNHNTTIMCKKCLSNLSYSIKTLIGEDK